MKIGMRRLRFFILFFVVCSPGLMIPQLIVYDEPSVQDVPLTTETVMKNTASLSMPFIKNEGQADPKVKFYANTFAGTAYLTENDLTYVIPTEDGSFVIKEAPHGGYFTPSADTPSETTVNYFKGTEENWHTDVPTYDSVSAGFVWDGVSLSLKAYGNNIEKLFTVFPGTNPDVIKMNFDGVESLSVDESGELLLHTTVGDITMTAPVAYQHVDGIKKFVPVKYSISSSSYGFVLGDYEKTLPVVIDPLLASTFLGGSDEDTSNAIAIDSSGNVYVTGSTIDHTTDLPTTGGAYNEALNGGQDIYVSKFSSDLTSLSASTYFGGGGTDDGLDIAIDSSDNVYVTGWTQVHATLQPTTDGAYDESHNGSYDAFVSKFSSDLTSLSASTFLGGAGIEFGFAIAIDSSDNVFVTGYTGPASTDFPVTDGAYDEDRVNQGAEVFVSKFSNDLTSLSASTFLGGSSTDFGHDIAIDSSDNVYVTGETGIKPGWPESATNLPVTSGAYDESHNGSVDAFVSKFSNDLTSLSASTFLGGNTFEYGFAIAIDSSDNVYVTGYATDGSDMPTTSGAYDESMDSTSAFVSKFSSDLTSLSASTFLGGNASTVDAGYAIAFDSSGNVYVTGSTGEPSQASRPFPVTSGAYDESHNGGTDAFVSKFSSDLTSLSESTFLGGSGNDVASDIAIDSSDNVYVTGTTADDTTDLPTTGGAYNESHNGDDDVFVSKFSFDNTGPTVTITSSSGDCGDTVNSTTLSYTATFSESTSNFVVGDITVTGTANGGSPEASNFAGSGTTYTFDVVQGSSDGTVIVSIAAGVATDAAVNLNTASDSCTFTIETVSPTVTITSSSGDCGDTVNSTTLSYTATFSESTSNFVVGDITVTGTANGGSPEASNFAGSGTTYTFDVVKGSSDGTVIVSVAAGVATDAAGNDNTASDSCTFTINIPVTTTSTAASTAASTGGTCSRHVILGNCGTIAINNDVYRIIDTWTNVPTTEVLVGQPVTVTLSTPNSPTHTKIPFASVHIEVFSVPLNYKQSAHVDYSIMNNQVTYVSQSQLFQVAGATHRISQDPDVKNLEMFEVVFTMIFAKPMETSHVVVETKNKFGIPETLYLMSALKVNENLQQALTLEEKSKFSIVDPESVMKPLGFVDPEKDPSHYVKRYLTEPKYKEWFDRNFPTYTIYDAIGITFAEYQEIESQLVDPEPEMEMDPEPEMEMDPEPEPTKKEKSKRQRR